VRKLTENDALKQSVLLNFVRDKKKNENKKKRQAV